MIDIEIDLQNIDYNLKISDYAEKYGVGYNTIKRRFQKLGVYDRFKFVGKSSAKVKMEESIKEYEKNPKLCENCKSPINYHKSDNRHCSLSCSATNSQKLHPRKWDEQRRLEYIKKCKERGTMRLISEKRRKKFVEIKCGYCQIEFTHNASKPRQFCSRKCSSAGCSKQNRGGFRENSGRGKSGWYKGYFCQSSWELAWVIYHIESGVTFERNKHGFPYILEGKLRKYYPDFFVPSTGGYVEIKGWNDASTKAKTQQFPHKLSVLYKKEMQPILDYVKSKYGADFIKLYEPKKL